MFLGMSYSARSGWPLFHANPDTDYSPHASLGYSEKIEVQAFDDRDNVFTSLAGLHFDWRDVDFNVLRVIRLKSTNVMMTEAQEKVEAEGMLGDSVQIEDQNRPRWT